MVKDVMFQERTNYIFVMDLFYRADAEFILYLFLHVHSF